MQLRDVSFSKPQENIFFDEVLFRLAEKNQDEYVRFWESPVYFIVLGRIGKEEDDVDLGTAQSAGISLMRRTSGGGTVVQGPGCLNYTLVFSKKRDKALADLHASYKWISAKVVEALEPQGIEAVFRPLSDIAVAGGDKKFSGNAQHRGKTHILHHGTILYNFNLGLISKYLRMPKDIPAYRQGRSHEDFVTNIPIKPQIFKSALLKALDVSAAPQPPALQEIATLQNYIK